MIIREANTNLTYLLRNNLKNHLCSKDYKLNIMPHSFEIKNLTEGIVKNSNQQNIIQLKNQKSLL